MKNNLRNLTSIVLILVGVAFLLSTVEILPYNLFRLFISWQTLLITMGILLIAFRNWVGGMSLLLIGSYFILPRIFNYLGIQGIDRQMINQLFFAVIFLSIGFWFLLKRKQGFLQYCFKEMKVYNKNGIHEIRHAFGEYQYVPIGNTFLGAKLYNAFGTLTVDLSSVQLEKENTRIEFDGIFGGIEVLVPDHIYTVHRINSFMAEVKDQRQEILRRKNGEPVLELAGNIAFGEIKIHSVKTKHVDTRPEEQEEELAQSEKIDNITVKQNKEVHIIPIEEVRYIQSDGDYVTLITTQGKYLKEETMKFFQYNLPSDKFLRIHRSYIVNISEISSISSQGKDVYYVVLKDGTQLKASIQGYQLLKQKWDL